MRKTEVTITGLNHDGEGVGRILEKVVFVPSAIPGDVVLVDVISNQKSYSRALILEILTPSKDRVAPFCPHASLCGGCQLQPMAYGAQLYWKERQLTETLSRVGGISCLVRPVLGMEEPFLYRNKAQFPVGGSPVCVGFYQTRSHEIVDLKECLVQHPLLVKLATHTRTLMRKLHLSSYDEKSRKGLVRHMVGRVSFSANELMAILVTTRDDFPAKSRFVLELREAIPELTSVVQNVNAGVTNVIFGLQTRVLWGKDHVVERLGDLSFALSPRSFFQVNPYQAKILYDEVKRAIPSSARVIWDIYCGTGTIGLYSTNDKQELFGVEVIPEAIFDAKRNARQNARNAEFLLGKAEVVLPAYAKGAQSPCVVILDPPRKGCDPLVLEAVIETHPKSIVYVSCNAATLARDLRVLVSRGFAVQWVQPVDMFPHTSHLECVVLLER